MVLLQQPLNQVVIGDASDGCVDTQPQLEAFLKRHPELEFDTRSIGKRINADVSLSFNDELLGCISCKFHVRPIDEVISFEKTLQCEFDSPRAVHKAQ